MAEKKKMFEELHERWKELDLPEERREVLNRVERDIAGLDQEKLLRVLIGKLRIDLNNPELWFKLGATLSEAQKHEFALAALDITGKIEPEEPYLSGVKGYVLTKLGRIEEAKKSLQVAIEQAGPVRGYEDLDDLIEGINSGKVELRKFTLTPKEAAEPSAEVLDLEKEMDELLIGEEKAVPSKTDLESKLEALSDELEKILGETEEEEVEVYKCPECDAEIEAEAEVCPNCGVKFIEMEEVPEALKAEEEIVEEYECPECGRWIPADATQCPECGTKFEEEEGEIFACPACGEEVDSDAIKCPSCGAEFVSEEEELEAVLDELIGEEPLESLVMPKPEKAEVKAEAVGLTNGLTNGLKIPKPGLTPGITPGITNGLTNGLRALRAGITNGLTNGNGITNGLGPKHGVFEPKRSKLKLALVPIVVLILVFSPFILINISEQPEGIRIDGSFGDWSGVTATTDNFEAAPFNNNVDIVDYRVDDREMDMSFYLKVQGDMLAGESGGGRHVDTVYIFIDTDQDANTGYFIEGLGADYMAEIYGWSGEVVSDNLYSYTETAQDWNLWDRKGSVRAAASGSELEVKVSFGALYLKNHEEIEVLFYMQSYDGYEDFSDTVISNEKGVLVVGQQGVGDGYIAGNGKRLLRLDLSALNAEVTMTSLTITRTGKGSDDDVSDVRLMEGSTTIASGTLTNGILTLVTTVPVSPGNPRTLHVVVDVGGGAVSGNSIGFRVDGRQNVTTDKGTVSVKRDKPDDGDYESSYLLDVPENVTIDGAFMDWEGKHIRNDSDDDVRADLDIMKYGVSNTDDGAAFYLRVDGEIAGGVKVPYWNRKVKPVPVTDGGGDGGGGEPVPLQPKTGEDVVYIFIDTVSGGYRGYGLPISADYMIEVRGRYNKVLSRSYYGWSGTHPFDWDWTPGGSVDVGLDTMRMEVGIDWGDIEVNPLNDRFDVYFITTDWKKSEKDQSDHEGAIEGPTRAYIGDGGGRGYDVKYHGTYDTYFDEDSGRVLFETREGYYLSWDLPRELKLVDGDGKEITVAGLTPTEFDIQSSKAYWAGLDRKGKVSVEYLFGENLLKENIVIEEKIFTSEELDNWEYLVVEMPIEYSDGLLIMTDGIESGVDLITSNAIDFYSGTVLVYSIEAPIAIDADGNTVSCEYVYTSDSPDMLSLRCPSDWLESATYPVKIDPSIILENNNDDNEQFGTSVAVGNFNGDSYDDLLVGAPEYNSGDGRAYIFYGSASGISDHQSPDLTLSSQYTGEKFGFDVAVGDLNGDNYDDAIIGAPSNDEGGTNIGRAYVFNGSGSMDSSLDMSLIPPSGTGSSEFGRSVATGDFDNDGKDDALIGAPSFSSSTGRVYVYNESGTYIAVLTGPYDNGEQFGYAVATGNFDNDNYYDAIIGAPTNDEGGTDIGRAYVYWGTGSGLNDTITDDSQSDFNDPTPTKTDTNVTSNGDVKLNLSSSSTTILSDDFDDDIPGNPPDDWTTNDGAQGGKINVDVDNTVYVGSSGNSVKFDDNTNQNYGYMENSSITSTESGTVDWYMRAAQTDDPFECAAYNSSYRIFRVMFDTNGNITYGSGTNIQTYSVDIWYHIKVEFYGETQTYDIYIDDVLQVNDASYDSSSATALDKLNFNTAGDLGNPPKSIFYVDEVYVNRTDYHTSGNFESGTLTSATHNIVTVSATWNETKPSGTDITLKVRASSSVSWASADSVSNGELVTLSTAGKNLQYNFTLTGDGSETPLLHNVTLNYTFGPTDLAGQYTGENFGSAVGSGNFDGSGGADAIVGAPLNNSAKGAAYIFQGNNIDTEEETDGVDSTFDKGLQVASTWQFGFSVASGDANGDSYDDAIIGAPYTLVGGQTHGKVYVYYGPLSSMSSSSPDVTYIGENGERLGWDIVMGDFLSGIYDEVAMGAPLNGTSDDDGRVVIEYIPEFQDLMMPIIATLAIFIFWRRKKKTL